MSHSTSEETTSDDKEPIVQYILVRMDLKWSTGANIAQACHASVASIAKTLTCPTTKSYLSDLENMHKVILAAENRKHLSEVEEQLKTANIAYHLWVEQPEDVATCLAVSPQPKQLVKGIFQRFRLLR